MPSTDALSLRPGTITGLIGPNGAGKSTLFNVIVGLYAPDEGQIYFNGQRLDGLPPYSIVRKGLIKTFPPAGAGERLTDLIIRPWEVPRAERAVIDRAEEVLEIVGLRALRDEYAKNLSGGQKKLLEVARALMAKPRMILLDEPVAGVNPTLTQRILGVVEDLRNQGMTFFLVEHDMDVVMSRCEWIIVMHQGRRLVEGVAEAIKANASVIDSYLGG